MIRVAELRMMIQRSERKEENLALVLQGQRVRLHGNDEISDGIWWVKDHLSIKKFNTFLAFFL
jgi:hypothetical protein